jgi:lipopolysaccharide/colanic/teichoic acid biosynthesis glycosyltransferase
MVSKLDNILFDEKSFAKVLCLERKRTDRSHRLFLMVLLEFSPLILVGKHRRLTLVKNIIQTLKFCIRQTDIIGWYKKNTAIGIIFTELYLDKPDTEKILEKVTTELQVRLTPEQLSAITVSVYVHPHQDSETPWSSDNHKLFPDLKQKKVARFIKRTIDFLGSLSLLVLLAPILVVISMAIRLTSKGPILFKQTRIGQFGRMFIFLKFRSMYMESNSKAHERYVKDFILGSKNGAGAPEALKQDGLYKLSRDPRVTPVGRFLRKTSLDELPQLCNVLMGRMSLVGPRPPLPYEVEHYDTWHMRRMLEAKPGMTGLWQVKGRSRTTFDDMVRLDLRYVNEWSIWADIKILLQTPWVVLRCEGAR